MKTATIHTLQSIKANGDKFSVITAYDACFARQVEQAGIDVILVGDSLGMVLQGHPSTLPVSIDDMAYHTQCVTRGCQTPMIVTDMPFGSYTTFEQTLSNAAFLMQSGAHMVKLEGGEWLLDSISALTVRGIPVCAHLGLTPQSVNAFGGFKVQGREPENAKRILADALAIQQAGATLLVLECIPSDLATEITQTLDIPVIGIGAGPNTDAQVLVLHDLLGLSDHSPRFVRNFMEGNTSVLTALQSYDKAVKNGTFPGPEHCFK